MLNCIIIEDQPPAQRVLQKFILNKPQELKLLNTFSNVIEAESFLNNEKVDLILLDINLPKISGIDFLKSIKAPHNVVLTTAYSDYALESYEYNVADYLLKPFSFDRFSQAIEKVKKLTFINNHSLNDYFIYVKSGHDLIKVKSSDILYIKSDSDYTEIITQSKKYLSSDTLKEWISKLNNNFCQVHKSFIVNVHHLNKISQNKIHLPQSKTIPIGRSFKKEFMGKYVC